MSGPKQNSPALPWRSAFIGSSQILFAATLLFTGGAAASVAGPEPLSGVSQIAAGDAHSCAVLRSGALKCWGDNRLSQLANAADEKFPGMADVIGLDRGVVNVAIHGDHTCALTDAGHVWCWGRVPYGLPARIAGLDSDASAVAVGTGHGCAITGTGVKCWGFNELGQLGHSGPGSETPVQAIGAEEGATAVAAGASFSCAIISGGLVKCWGANFLGQLGRGVAGAVSAPGLVVGLTRRAVALAAGDDHACALLEDNSVSCWGKNQSGQLGDGSTNDRALPLPIPGLRATAIAAGREHTCAVDLNGTPYCWGGNSLNALGGETAEFRATPGPVAGLAVPATAVAVGRHSCALTSDSRVHCWGSNFEGQLGYNLDGWVPVESPATDGNDGYGSSSKGTHHNCELRQPGEVWCRGSYTYSYTVGRHSFTRYYLDRPLLERVLGLPADVTGLKSGTHHTCARTASGKRFCWGDNYAGQLGIGGQAYRYPRPVQVMVPTRRTGDSAERASAEFVRVLAGSGFPTFAVKVRHADGTPAVNVPVTATAVASPASAGSAFFNAKWRLPTQLVWTDADGIASFGALIANTVAGRYPLEVRVAGLAKPLSFALQNDPLHALSFNGGHESDFFTGPSGNNQWITAWSRQAGGPKEQRLPTDGGETLLAVADLDHDGRADYITRMLDGEIRIRTTRAGEPTLITTYSTVVNHWELVGTGDLDGDGHDDLVWRATAADPQQHGRIGYWMMKNLMPVAKAATDIVDPAWQASGITDLDLDGKADLLWTYTGAAAGIPPGLRGWWKMDGTTAAAKSLLEDAAQTAPLDLRLVKTLRYGGAQDRQILVFQHITSGQLELWSMLGGQRTHQGTIPATPGSKVLAATGGFPYPQPSLVVQEADGRIFKWEVHSNATATRRDLW